MATLVGVTSTHAIAQVPLTARTIYVNPATGTDTTSAGNSEGNAFKTITYALQQASPNTLIQLAAGNYTRDTGEVFPLILPPGVILRGDDADKGQRVAIIGGNTYPSPTEANQNVTLVALSDNLITGLTITNPNARGTGLWIQSSSPTVRNSTFSNSKRDGIFVTSNASPKIEDSSFIRNEGNGISFARTSRGELRNNLFQETGFGITLSENASPSIVQNRIFNNVDGIVASGSTAPVIRENIIEGNQRDGIVVISDSQPNLGTAEAPGQNQFSNNGRYAINNASRTNTLQAYGNAVDRAKVAGRVDLGNILVAFNDVQGHWAEPYIAALASKNIIAGFPNGTFRPSDPVTRAQFAAIVNQAFAPAAQRPAINFSDVRSNYWANQAIQTAYQGGFLSGYPGQIFQPEQRIPRVQVLVSLASGLNLNSNNANVLSVYNDVNSIPNYAIPAVAAATERELVVNYPTSSQLNPNQEATRAEVAAFVYQALVNAGRAEAIPSPYVVKNPSSAQQ